MTLDRRLLTEDGRKQIAKDYEKSKKIIDTVDKIVSTEDWNGNGGVVSDKSFNLYH